MMQVFWWVLNSGIQSLLRGIYPRAGCSNCSWLRLAGFTAYFGDLWGSIPWHLWNTCTFSIFKWDYLIWLANQTAFSWWSRGDRCHYVVFGLNSMDAYDWCLWMLMMVFFLCNELEPPKLRRIYLSTRMSTRTQWYVPFFGTPLSSTP